MSFSDQRKERLQTIMNKKEFKRFLKEEKHLHFVSKKHFFIAKIAKKEEYFLWKYVKALRYREYYFSSSNKLIKLFWERQHNQLGIKLGLQILPNSVSYGLKIWHSGNIVIHRDAKVGKNCQLHGMNVIGNKGIPDSGAPTIGDNVNIGVGAVIIGDVYIADNVTIAANAVVTKSCYREGAVLAGVPAKIIE